LLRAGFRQRRKTLVNNLKGDPENFGDVKEWLALFERLGIDPRARAEELTGQDWLNLHNGGLWPGRGRGHD
jgi:16S rRNA A1518/A1519 N6-dimethyltransferase RsmA/KsgA/DIM1 with predicted DNA glycosylase/AP lyase activity